MHNFTLSQAATEGLVVIKCDINPHKQGDNTEEASTVQIIPTNYQNDTATVLLDSVNQFLTENSRERSMCSCKQLWLHKSYKK